MDGVDHVSDQVAGGDVAAIHREGLFATAGAIGALAGKATHVGVVRTDDVFHLLAAVQSGDALAALMLGAAVTVATKVNEAAPGTGITCLACDRPVFGRPYAAVCVSAPPPSPYICGPVCAECATEPQAIRQAALPGLRQVWPDFKLLPPIHAEAGHA